MRTCAHVHVCLGVEYTSLVYVTVTVVVLCKHTTFLCAVSSALQYVVIISKLYYYIIVVVTAIIACTALLLG